MGIVDRIGSLAGTEAARAVNFAHETFQARHAVHGHATRALIETIAEVCRKHPNLVGLGAGLLVEQLLVHEKHLHDEHARDGGAAALPSPVPSSHTAPHLAPHIPGAPLSLPTIRLDQLRPGRIAMEVFGALVLLKFGRGLSRALRRRHTDPWFAPAARIHLFSASIAAYYLAKSLKARKVSAWRNAAVALFGTDAVKPLLKPGKGRPPAAAAAHAAPSPEPRSPEPSPPEPQTDADPPPPPMPMPPSATGPTLATALH